MPPAAPHAATNPTSNQTPLSTAMVYLSFAATGIGMALPGSLLPAILARWSLADSQAGLLFFLCWSGSSIGALLTRKPFSSSVAIGNLLLAIAACGLAFSVHQPRIALWVWMTLFGIGLGISMTATSLLQAARNPHRRAAELTRLNLVWALGASLSPSLAAHSLRVTSVRSIFSAFAVLASLLFLWAALRERDPASLPTSIAPTPASFNKRSILAVRALWPASIIAIILLPTGIESSMGAWIAAYVLRTQHAIATTVTAGSCFWVGLMLSRTCSSILLRTSRARPTREGAILNIERELLSQSLITVVLAIVLLLLSHTALGTLLGAFLIGFGLGPVYPMLLATALKYSDNTLIFFIAGLGSAFVPWLTGVVSTANASLRAGLLVPLAASVLMLALGLRIAWLKSPAPPQNPAPHEKIVTTTASIC